MKTVALRFSDKFAPDEGTIIAHENIIKGLGYVWYGKLGLPLSQKAIDYVKGNEDPKVLLIHSGKTMRYWAHVVEVLKGEPDIDGIPSYYRDNRDRFKTWFKVIKFEVAPKDIMSKCTVISSGAGLGEVSKHSMSPYFIIEVEGE
ncbi:hypothetical protein [Sellimonas sp.]|uniref:hypothetical protein n=1 Tax=Sellimonas sp. TaxID=2021466 RepID=UPI00257B4909|nr:hypothetical protein [Sellimonas sp.]